MSGFWPIFKRELFALFVTPLAWILITAFLVMQGLHFFLLLDNYANASGAMQGSPIQAFFGGTVLLYLPLFFICPLLTMRLFAEERRSGTIEALLTAPVGTSGVVLAKFAATFVTYLVLWAPTVLYVVLTAHVGDVDWRTVGASYLAIAGVGAGYLAIGTMTSAFATSQLTAALLSAMTIVVLFMVGIGEFIVDVGPAHDVCAYVSVWSQMNEASQGIVDLRRVVLDATIVALPLFITVRAVDAWKWS